MHVENIFVKMSPIAIFVVLLGIFVIPSSSSYWACPDGEIKVSYCPGLELDERCSFCQPDSNLGGQCITDSNCHDAEGNCDGKRCGCNGCNVCACLRPYLDSNGPYYGGECSRGTNLGSRCVHDTECYDGRHCNGTTCGCYKQSHGLPKCGCNVDLGYRDSNGDDAVGGECVLSNNDVFSCYDTDDCFDNIGPCDDVRCGCHCNVCRNFI